MDNREILNFCLQGIKDKGLDKGQCIYSINEKYELNFTKESISLLRTTKNSDINLTGIKDNKKSSIKISNLDHKNIENKIGELVEMCDSSKEDEFNDIAPNSDNEEFKYGSDSADLHKMYDLILDFIKNINSKYEQINLIGGTNLTFNKKVKYIGNTNSVYFKSDTSNYSLALTYAAKNQETSSSFNFAQFQFDKLPESFIEYENIDKKFKEAVEQLYCIELEEKFLGDLILTPELANEFVVYYNQLFLCDLPIISKTSMLKDKLGKKVADNKLTVLCESVSDEISNKVFVTSDGMKTYNFPIIENGILNTFLLTLYGSRKTKKKFVPYTENIRILNGDKKIDDIMKSTNKGIILGRFSGGQPASNGDFSGVAKNSYYIENGEIKYPIKEVMISGNIYEMFNNIEYISEETLNTGCSITPWIKVNNVTISGKA